MKFRIRINKYNLLEYIIKNYYWFVVFGYIVSMFYLSFPIAIFSGVLFLIMISGAFLNRRMNFELGSLYFIYISATGVMYFFNNMPLNVYITSFAYQILPMGMYFLPKNNSKEFYKITFNALIFSFVIAYILYFLQPGFYAEYGYLHGYLGQPRVEWIRPSLLQGLYGITMVGSFAAMCSVYYFLEMWDDSNNKIIIVKFLFSFMTLLFTSRRSAIFSCVLVLFISFFIKYRRNKLPLSFAKKIVVFFVITTFAVVAEYDSIIKILHRVLAVSKAVGERSGNWEEVLTSFAEYIVLGKGIGSSGHVAVSMGYLGVPDSSYVQLLVETGVIGFVFFFLLIVYSFIKFWNNQNKSYISAMIVIIFLIQCLGSNLLEFPTLSAIFWYSLSRMSVNCE